MKREQRPFSLFYKTRLPPEGHVLDSQGKSAGIATVRRVETAERLVALTFDDGPDAVWTPAKLESLARSGATATFFVLGRLVDRLPERAREIVLSGSELGNHSFSHPWLSRQGHSGVVSQLQRTQEAVRKATGVNLGLFRPPYGDYDAVVLRAAGATGHTHNVLWDIDPSDYRRPSAASITAHILARVKPGSIVVLHDNIPETARALPGLLGELRGRGYRAVTVSRLLAAVPDAPPGPRTLRVTTPYMRGNDVRLVQEALLSRGIDPGPVDGIYGPRTAGAVGVFQAREGLPNNRVVTPEVYARLGMVPVL